MTRKPFSSRLIQAAAAAALVYLNAPASAVTVQFFDSSQNATTVEEGVTWDTISTRGHRLTYTRDKLFTGGIGAEPIGRPVRVPWPQGVEAQAVTAGPATSKAKITLSRVDGGVFDLTAFSAKLLANTYGAGASFEIMPKLDGEDVWNDPAYFNATGFYGQTFSYDETTPGYLGNTSLLKDFDEYTIALYVDFAWTALTLVDDTAGLPGDFDGDAAVDGADFLAWQRGESGGGPLSTADLTDWRGWYGAATAAALAVPEPPARGLVLIAVAMFLWAGLWVSR